jgi:hypothetical protein
MTCELLSEGVSFGDDYLMNVGDKDYFVLVLIVLMTC